MRASVFVCRDESAQGRVIHSDKPGHECSHKSRVPDHAAAPRVGQNMLQTNAKMPLKVRGVEELARKTARVHPQTLEPLLGGLNL